MMENKLELFERETKYEILDNLKNQLVEIDFVAKLYPDLSEEEQKEKKVTPNDIKVITVKEILQAAENNRWQLCKQNGFVYLYNGEYWEILNGDDVKHFLSDCSERLGTKYTMSKETEFVKKLYEQFLFSAYLRPPKFAKGTVLINLLNGSIHPTNPILPDSM